MSQQSGLHTVLPEPRFGSHSSLLPLTSPAPGDSSQLLALAGMHTCTHMQTHTLKIVHGFIFNDVYVLVGGEHPRRPEEEF